MSFLKLVLAYLAAARERLDEFARLGAGQLHALTAELEDRLWGERRAADLVTGPAHRKAQRGQLGIFMVLVFGAVALVVVSIVLLFGMDIAGEFAEGINVDNEYSDAANDTVNSTGDAFQLFGTSVLVIPAAAVLAVLIGGLIGAVAMVGGGGLPGMGGGGGMRGGR
jgi:ABC-type Fe3+ transport system permease subunit